VTALSDWLRHRAAVLPSHPALITGAGEISYAELDQRVDGVASSLAAIGVGAGDRVAILAQNSVEFVEIVHALPRLGAVLVPLNLRLTASELAWQLGDAGVRVLLADESTRALAVDAANGASLPTPAMLPLPPAQASTGMREEHDEDEIHSIIYTSGTTGRPKGAMLTFGNFWASAVGSMLNLGLHADDRWLACMPLFHVGGLSILLRSAIYGTTVVLHPGFDEREVARSLRRDGITLISVVATMLQRVLDVDNGSAPPSLRVVLTGGGPVPRPLLQRALDRGYPVVQTYGLTEAASQVATLAPADALARAGSAGKPLLTARLRIDAAPGEPGEILVAGPVVIPGYLNQPEATAAAIRDGWLHSGDIGRLDADGYLYVLDRRDDLIVTGGENVYPAEVESALMAHPDVEAAAVVAVPDPSWGQAVGAAIVTTKPVEAAELDQWIRTQVAGYKAPRRYMTLDALPMTANGKVQRHVVRQLFTDG